MPLEHAILAFLDSQPQTGYGLKKDFDSSVRHFWTATQSHIYKALENLEARAFVTSAIIPQEGKPNRKEYHLTPAGRAELHRWLTTPLPLAPVREAWMIQLFFAHPLANEDIAQLIQTRKDEIAAAMADLRAAQAVIDEQRQQAIPHIGRMAALWQMTLDYGLDHYRSELAWLDQAQEQARHLPAE